MKSIQQEAIEFIYVVKQRFIEQPFKFDEFATLVTSLIVEQDNIHLISKLKSLFANDHPDLLFGLTKFLPRKYETSAVSLEHDDNDDDTIDEDHPPKKKQCARKHAWLLRETASELFDKIRDRCIEKNDDEFSVLKKFFETVLSYSEKKITSYQVDMIFKNLFKDDPDLYVEFTRVFAQSFEKSSEKSELLRKGEKKSGDADCSLYEETMDVKEFYLFEMDLAFSRLESTIKKLEKDPESLEECFTVLDFKCIKELYNDPNDDHGADFGEEIVKILQTDSVGRVVARVVVLERLKQKRMQLEEQRLYLNKIWNEIFEDIMNKGRVRRHREFLRRTKTASINGFGKKKQ